MIKKLFAAMLVCFFAGAAAAQNPVGVWSYEMPFASGTIKESMEIGPDGRAYYIRTYQDRETRNFGAEHDRPASVAAVARVYAEASWNIEEGRFVLRIAPDAEVKVAGNVYVEGMPIVMEAFFRKVKTERLQAIAAEMTKGLQGAVSRFAYGNNGESEAFALEPDRSPIYRKEKK